MDLGRTIRMLRTQRGLSQAALGTKLNVSQKEISHYEKNYRTPPAELMPLLAEALGTTIDGLYGASAPKNIDNTLKKTTIWLIAEKLELLEEAERIAVLNFVNNLLAQKIKNEKDEDKGKENTERKE
ncbi:MAG: helix-turn-helix domain-containing protein [Chitinispirillaceae bacterium]|nr:helix-turn-helix domain-containing protein [Chitinispirillaceae bacterium]